MTELWNKQARKWIHIGPPLRPDIADITITQSFVKNKIANHPQSLSVLLLGVTPELVNIEWPDNTRFIAIDNNLAMLTSILPRNINIQPLALAGNWTAIPLKLSSIDIVLGDGCYTLVAEKDYRQMTWEIRRVLKPDGLFIMRFFTRPEENELIEVIEEDFLAGRINNFHALKWRIAMALHGSLRQGVCLKNIWNCWNDIFKKNIQPIMEQFKWTKEVVNTIDNYQNTDVYYTFPTLQEVRTVLHEYFQEQDIFTPSYILGDRCPSIKMACKGN